jgi:hypothetical protein
MLHEQQTAPLLLNLIWLEYTRLSKEVASAAVFGSSIKLETDPRRRALDLGFGGRSSELDAPLVEVAESVSFIGPFVPRI